MKKRLRKSEINIIADAMIYQTLQCFDMDSVETCDITDESKEKILELISKKSLRYMNNYSNIGNTKELVNNVIEMRL